MSLNEDKLEIFRSLSNAFNSNQTNENLIQVINEILELLNNYGKKWSLSDLTEQNNEEIFK